MMSPKRLLILTLLALFVSGGWLLYWLLEQYSAEESLKAGRAALQASQFDEAEQLARRFLKREPQHAEALFIAGTAASEAGRHMRAVEYFDRIGNEDLRAVEARFQAAEILLLRMFQLTAAEERLRSALRLDPKHSRAQQHLAGLLGLCGRHGEAAELRLERLRQGNFFETDLLLLALGEMAAENVDWLADFARASPDDPLTWLARAHEAEKRHDLALAEELLRRVTKARPDQVAAHARLGRILSDRDNAEAFAHWQAALPTAADKCPDIWTVRGDWSRQRGDLLGATRCYAEALRIDPTHHRANYQLSQALLLQGEDKSAEVYAARSAALQDVVLAAKGRLSDTSPQSLRRLVETCRRGGLAWEAWGWAQVLYVIVPSARNSRTPPRPAAEAPRLVSPDGAGVLGKLLKHPLPEWALIPRQDSVGRPVARSSAADPAGIVFIDDAASTGLDFEYVDGERCIERGPRAFQFTGGGVAVVDYDQDGWPDLFFPQGHEWPSSDELPMGQASCPPRPPDRLFRNLGNGRFEDVTAQAAVGGEGYGQGVTVGDFNHDGFPDLYVATFAGNRLYCNNGDGTYSDVTEESGTSGDRWTTSCLMADLNGNGLPDIYAVNYLQGRGLHDRICHNADGRPRLCTPHEFDAAQDQLYLNLGNGRFRDVTQAAGIVAPDGKGLGILAADFDGSGRLSLFVANDTTANFFFRNQTPSPGALPIFTESALTMGLAYDRDGRSQACMGIAAGDANGNGELDLFVTNYYDEAHTLYQRQASRLFADATHAAGLRDPSLKLLGFGTQFLDADLDGWPDLVVVNGHVDDETYRGVPYRMAPQFFQNTGGGRFTELRADTLGTWFSQPALGRALARLDWNRDGREDFVVTHLHSPVSLLTNRTRSPGCSIRIQLRGVESNRDAIGAIVHVRTQGRQWTQQLTAGDGYHASNQRQLVFGLGDAETVKFLVIYWPSGQVQHFGELLSGHEYLVIEGRPNGIYSQAATFTYGGAPAHP